MGIQYAEWSWAGVHVVALLANSESAVENASVLVLPMKVWLCEAPGSPGATIGSSSLRWLTLQEALNSGTLTGLLVTVRGFIAKNAATSAACLAGSTATQPVPWAGGAAGGVVAVGAAAGFVGVAVGPAGGVVPGTVVVGAPPGPPAKASQLTLTKSQRWLARSTTNTLCRPPGPVPVVDSDVHFCQPPVRVTG